MNEKKREKQEQTPEEFRGSAEAQAPPEERQAPADDDRGVDFPVVGIGASAGGLAAFETFFDNVPSDSGMAFVLVQHLSAQRKSILGELIRRHTEIDVSEVEDGVAIQPNHIYIIPPGKDLALLHGQLYLMEPAEKHGLRLPIDYFFRSLAQDQHARAICVVLSGTGTDGALGLKAVKEQGGIAMVQEPETAEYDGMPRSAIDTGLVDYILPPQEMPQHLRSYVEHAFGTGKKRAALPEPENTSALQKIFILLRAQTGHDFSHYKQTTIGRRIERRMAVNQISDVDIYVRYLRENPLEVETLFRDFLITVTNFFRDPEAFQALEEQVIPRLLEKSPDQPVRIWVPGCATGEEAYSIAILLREQMERVKRKHKAQIFATDIDREAIETARAGVYPNGIAADISPERLSRFFTQKDNAYHVDETIRAMVIFAEQNVIADPPFSRIDLLSCRNLLIYMDATLQKQVLPLFHYALRPEGFLFLGTSESVGEFTDLFATLDSSQKLFQRKESTGARRPLLAFAPPPPRDDAAAPQTPVPGEGGRSSARETVERALLQHHTPAGALVDEQGEVLYFHGHTGKYLEPAPGEAKLNVLRMARLGLKMKLTTALRKARMQKESVHYRGLRVKTNDEYQPLNLTVRPVQDLFLILFEDVTPDEELESIDQGSALAEDKDACIAQLEQELRAKEEYLQTTVEELETANEELKSTNEELQSANEELQSTNEELETAKEEAQSINEELRTVNAELEQKVAALSQVNDDVQNLLAGTGMGVIFLDEHLCIQRFTPSAAEVLNLIQTDVGRPVSHITSTLAAYDDLTSDAQQVLDTLAPVEKEVRTEGGAWYLLRIRPYRTQHNVIEGVVLTFVDVTALKRAEQELKATRDYAESIVETVREPLVILDADLRVSTANRAFYRAFQVEPEETKGVLFYELDNGQWDIPELRELLEEILPQETVLHNYEVRHTVTDLGPRTLALNAREVRRAADKERLILLAIEIEDESGRY